MGKLIHSFNVQNNDQTTTGRHLSHLQCPSFYQLLKWFTWLRNRSDLLNIITSACTNMSTHHSSKSLYQNRSDYNMIKVLPSRRLHCLPSCNVPMKISFGANTTEHIRGQSNFLCICLHTDLVLYMLFAVTFLFSLHY